MRDKRKVTRVLVMLEYGPDDPDNGEVFDLTALVEEMRTHGGENHYNADIRLVVDSSNYSSKKEADLTVQWTSYSPGSSSAVHSGHLSDVMNSAMPDGPRVQDLKAEAKKLRVAAAEIDRKAAEAKLDELAACRHVRPIARVTTIPLADVAAATLE